MFILYIFILKIKINFDISNSILKLSSFHTCKTENIIVYLYLIIITYSPRKKNNVFSETDMCS